MRNKKGIYKELLKKLKEEGFENVITEAEIEGEMRIFGKDAKIRLADDFEFRTFLKNGRVILETSYSNQEITDKWITRARSLYNFVVIFNLEAKVREELAKQQD